MKEKRIRRRRLASLALCLAMALSLHTPLSLTSAYAAEEQLLGDYEGVPVEAPVDPAPEQGGQDYAEPAQDNADSGYEGVPVEDPTAQEPAEPPVEEPAEPPVEEPTEPPVEEPTEPPVQEPTEPPVEEPSEPPMREPEPTADPEPTEEPEPTEAPTEEEEKKDETDALTLRTVFDEDIDSSTTVFVTGELPVDATVEITPVPVPEPMVQVLTLSLNDKDAAQTRETIAYDVTLFDGQHNVIEPAGPVDVQFRFGAASPVDAGAESFAVIHMEERADGVEAVNVGAQLEPITDPAGTATGEAVTNFEVTSFSTFVITWTNGDGEKEYSFQIKLNYVNANGYELKGFTEEQFTDGDATQSGSKEIYFSEYEKEIPGFVYKLAFVGDKNAGQVVTSVKVTQTKSGWFNPKYTTTATFYYESDGNKIEVTSFDVNNLTAPIEVYLVYEPEESSNPTTPNKPVLDHNKTATRNDNGTYDITLDVKGTSSQENAKKKVDVLFILDKSGSMVRNINDEDDASSGESRWDYVKGALNGFVNDLADEAELDVRFDVVAFSEYPGARYSYPDAFVGTAVDWTRYAPLVTAQVDGIKPYLGTNYHGGIYEGIMDLQSARTDAEVVVIFLTDGIPTYRGGMNGEPQYGNGSNDNGGIDYHYRNHESEPGDNIKAAVGQIKTMGCSQFYAIGIGPEFADGKDGMTNLQQLIDNVGADTGKKPATPLPPTPVNDPAALESIFNQIAANAKKFEISNVTITDNLSQYVTPVDGEPLKIVVTDNTVTPAKTTQLETTEQQDGSLVATLPGSGDKKVTASVVGGQVRLVFDEDYKLVEGWTYSVTVTVKPTQAAYNAYDGDQANPYPVDSNGEPTMVGEEGTGDHVGEAGLYSNDSATLYYKFNDDPINPPLEYRKPVIQIHPGKLVIEKTIEGLTDETALVNQLYFDVALNGGTATKYALKDYTPDANGKYTIEIKNLPPETTYEITEHDYAVTGCKVNTTYTVGSVTTNEDGTKTATGPTTAVSPVKGTIVADTVTTVSVVNKYSPDVYSLTIEKTLTDINKKMGKDATFVFEVTGPQGQKFTRLMSFKSGGKMSDSVTIGNLPAGDYTVEEKEVTGYQETSGNYWRTVTLGPDQTVRFKNSPDSGDDHYGDSAGVKNKVTFVNGSWTVSPDGGVDYERIN